MLGKSWGGPGSNDLTSGASNAQSGTTAVLAVAAHEAVLMDIPGLARSGAKGRITQAALGGGLGLLLVIFPFALTLALALHFAFEEGLRCPATRAGLLLGCDAASVLGVDFRSGAVVSWPVAGWRGCCWSRI